MPTHTPPRTVPVEANAARKRIAADRCDQRAAKLRAEADVLIASKTKSTTATK